MCTLNAWFENNDNGGHLVIIDTLCTVRQMRSLKIIICVNNVFEVVLNV